MEKRIDLRILKTQKALCESFMKLLERRRFEDITVNELCEDAMVWRATFYKHFQDKYDFFAFFVQKIQGEFNDKIREMKGDSRNSYYVDIFKECIMFIKNHEKVVDSIIHSSVFPALLEILADEIEENVLRKLEEDKKDRGLDIQERMRATFYTGGSIQVLRFWMTSPDPMPEEELVERMREILDAYQIV